MEREEKIIRGRIPNKKYIHISAERFLLMVEDVMSLPEMKFAYPADVAEEIAQRYGGKAESYLNRIYRMRLKMSDFLKKEEKEG